MLDMDVEVDGTTAWEVMGVHEEHRKRSSSKLFRGFTSERTGTPPPEPTTKKSVSPLPLEDLVPEVVVIPAGYFADDATPRQDDESPDAQVLLSPTKQKRGRTLSQPVAQGIAKVNSSPDVLSPEKQSPAPRKHRLDRSCAEPEMANKTYRSFKPTRVAAGAGNASYCIGIACPPTTTPQRLEKKPVSLSGQEEGCAM